MRRVFNVLLLLALLPLGLMACANEPEESAPEQAAPGATEAVAPGEPPTFSSGFESGDTSEWSETSSEEEEAEPENKD